MEPKSFTSQVKLLVLIFYFLVIMNHLISAVVLLIVIASIDFTAGQIGVCYKRNGDIPSPADAVRLCRQNNIRRMRIYDPDRETLQALRGSKIEVCVGVPNQDLQNIAVSQDNANAWVRKNIQNFPDVKFRYIAVGNEVSPATPKTAQYVGFVVPAMRNIYKAISSAGLGGRVRVSTAVDTGLVDRPAPYSTAEGAFRHNVTDYVDPIVRFLVETTAPLLVNVYPYYAYIHDKANIPLDYALFTGKEMQYQNLFYAMVEAMYSALEKRGGSSVEIVVSESGWPSYGGDTAASAENAKTYNKNLIQRARDGTPKRPGKAIETYIFTQFDENQKDPEYDKHLGIFLANLVPRIERRCRNFWHCR